MSRVLAGAGIGAALVVGYLVAAYFAQRSMLFQPPPSYGGRGADPAEVVQLDIPAGAVEAFFLPPTVSGQGPAPLLIFTHGNAELAEYWVDEFEEPRSWGWGVLLVEYPGYGRSAGKPSEQSVKATILAAHDWAMSDPRVDAARVVAYGRSLGGAAAAQLAAERRISGIILESSFTSVRPLAARFLVPGFLVRDPFDNIKALRDFRGPMLVLHGLADQIIPISEGRALAAAVSGAELHELPCGHNDCPSQWGIIRAFLTSNDLTTRAQNDGLKDSLR